MEKNCFTHRHESTANHQGEVDRLIYIIYIYNIYIKNNKQINTPIPNIDQINIYIYILKYIYIYISIYMYLYLCKLFLEIQVLKHHPSA